MARVVDHLSLEALEEGLRSASDPTRARHFQVIWLAAGEGAYDCRGIRGHGLRAALDRAVDCPLQRGRLAGPGGPSPPQCEACHRAHGRASGAAARTAG